MNQDGCTGSFDAAIHTKEVHTLLLIQTIHVKYAFTHVKKPDFITVPTGTSQSFGPSSGSTHIQDQQ